MLRMIARCVRRVHRLGSRCDGCLPTSLRRLDPPEQHCNWQPSPTDCALEDCALEILEAVEELRLTYDIEWIDWPGAAASFRQE